MPPKKHIPSKQLKTPAPPLQNTSASLSVYAAGLLSDHLERYLNKISIIGNKDPYLLQMNTSDLPLSVSYESIIEYALHKQSAYTGSTFRCFKAMEAKVRFESGMVKSVEGVQMEEFHVVRGKVMHSMSINDPCLTPWLIVKDSDVMSAHCDCIAGIGEVCSHVGAVLYHLTGLNHHQLLLSQCATTGAPTVPAVTDTEQRWGRPSKSVPGNLQLPLENIDFGYTRDSSDDNCGNVPMLWVHDIRAKLNELQKDGVQCTSMQSFCSDLNKCFKCEEKDIDPYYASHGLLLNALYDEKYREMSIEQLRYISLSVYKQMQEKLDEESRLLVESETQTQSDCELWKLLRIGRVTASTLKNVISTKIEQPSISLLNTICYPDESYFSTQATRYGKKMEKTAIQQLSDDLLKTHIQAKVVNTGLIIHKQFSELAASPDAILMCACCGKIPIEIKCPFNFKDEDNVILRLTKCKPAYIKQIENSFEMISNHKYFAQVQMQIALTESQYGYFYVWTKKDSLLIRVEKDAIFWYEAQSKATLFFKAVILPELLAKHYTRRLKF